MRMEDWRCVVDFPREYPPGRMEEGNKEMLG